jgi:predicted dehydrogenase
MSNLSRRQFLENSMFAAAAAVAASSAGDAYGADEQPKVQPKSPNEQLAVACIAAGGQGSLHVKNYSDRKDTVIRYIVEPDSERGNKAAQLVESKTGKRPQVIADIRRALEDKSLDLVSIATPNHWHALGAIWAMQAGKDVYVEKPVSHNVSEGRRMVEAARKYNRICQTGTQCRSMKGSIDAIDYVKSGKIGELKVSRALCYKSDKRGSIGPKGQYPVPTSVDYDTWLGPAPLLTYSPRPTDNFHYYWHWFWAYGNGDLGNQGIHEMDKARWGLGVDKLAPKVISYGGRLGFEDCGEAANEQVVILDYGDKALVHEVRGIKSKDYKGASVGNVFEGTDGYVVLTKYTEGAAFDKDGNKVQEFKGGGNHFGNFIDAVRSRNMSDLHADILEGHLSSALCHLGNISYRLGKQVNAAEGLEKLKTIKCSDKVADTFDRFQQHLMNDGSVDITKTTFSLGEVLDVDTKTESFVNNPKADAMLTREYRPPYIVPAAGQV